MVGHTSYIYASKLTYKTAHGVNGELDKFFLVKEILDRVNGSILPSDSRLIPGLSVTFSLSLRRDE